MKENVKRRSLEEMGAEQGSGRDVILGFRAPSLNIGDWTSTRPLIQSCEVVVAGRNVRSGLQLLQLLCKLHN